MRNFIFTGFISILLACSGPNNGPAGHSDTAIMVKSTAVPDTTTLGGRWWLQPVLASDTAAGKIPELQFDTTKSHFTGNTGCNKMSGTFWYSGNDSSLVFSDKFVTTKMACQGYNEAAFVKNLLRANHYRFQNGVLVLLVDNTELSRWTRKPPRPSKLKKA